VSIPDDVPDDRENVGEDDKVILIVEDDTNFAKSLLDFTRKRGYKGVVSVRGDEAFNMALMYRPIGVLLDIQLPVKSGWEVMEDLKNNWQTKHIPVHMMSSHRMKQESLLKGAVNFLDKPVAYEQMPEIFKRIEHIVNKESQKVLILEDNPKHAKALAYFLETYNINSEIKSDVTDGVDALQKNAVDCVILDMGIPDQHAYEILDGVKKNPGLENLPVIVFTGKSLSMKEELKIKKYADSIVVKTAHSYQRMLDEVSLFLHLVEENKGAEKKDTYKKLSLLNNVLSDKTVLVVDDDVRNIYSLTKALEVLKMNVITAIDGKEALKALEEHPEIDVVLLDMMMPNMDGYETATRIRQYDKYKTLPVIAVTAKAMTGDREKCINAGASDYITKPVDVDQLLSLLRVWMYDQQSKA
jgi:CheY-like chemotaxis protein